MNTPHDRRGHAAALQTIQKEYPDGSVAHEAIDAAVKELRGPPMTLFAAAEYVCQHLPEGYEVQLNMEKGAAWVSLWRTDAHGAWDLELPDAADKSLADQLVEAIVAALEHSREASRA